MNECMLSPGHNGIHSLQIKHKSLSFRKLQVTKEDINMNTRYENKDVSQGLRKYKGSCHLNWENYGELLGGGDFECHKG